MLESAFHPFLIFIITFISQVAKFKILYFPLICYHLYNLFSMSPLFDWEASNNLGQIF